MHKAEQALRRLLPFRRQIETIIGNLLTADADFSSPLLDEREVKRLAVVAFGSDDGLCGAYNINIFKQLLGHIADYRERYGQDVEIEVYPIGKKMLKAVSKLASKHIHIRQQEGVDSKTSGDGVRVFIDDLQRRFLDKEIDRVDVLYMNFITVSRQRPRHEQLLPVVSSTFADNGVKAICRPYIFEPDPQTIFRSVLPMFLLSMMQEIFIENRASEQAARIMAMQSANDNAKKLLEQLRLEYNKLRQQSITTELLDILGGQVR